MKTYRLVFLALFSLSFTIFIHAQQSGNAQPNSTASQTVQSVKYPELRDELLKRLKTTRALRDELIKKYNGMMPATEAQAIMNTDQENAGWLKTNIEKHGWLGKSLVGDDGEDAAFKLVMLAIQDSDFQKKSLELLRKAIKSGEAPDKQASLLSERINDMAGKISMASGSPGQIITPGNPGQTITSVSPKVPNQPVKNPQLREEILQRLKSDQEVRIEAMKAVPPGTPLPENVLTRFRSIDKENTQRMKEIVKQYGIPTNSMIGPDAANAAFIMIQHADQDLEFQKQCLELLKKAVEEREMFPASVAYLTDRIRVAEGKPQLYGTQTYLSEGKLIPRPIEDAANVDKRRAAVGLNPLADYMERMQKTNPPNN